MDITSFYLILLVTAFVFLLVWVVLSKKRKPSSPSMEMEVPFRHTGQSAKEVTFEKMRSSDGGETWYWVRVLNQVEQVSRVDPELSPALCMLYTMPERKDVRLNAREKKLLKRLGVLVEGNTIRRVPTNISKSTL